MVEAVARAKPGDRWQDEHGVVHLVHYTYPVGAVLLACEEKVPKKSVAFHLTKAPATCLECLNR